VLLIFIAIGIIVGAIYFIFYFRESNVAKLIESGSVVSTIVVENNGDKTESIYLCFYNPDTEKIGIIAVPERTRLKIEYADRPVYDAVENIYLKGGASIVRNTVENLTDTGFDYYLKYDLNDVEILVDLLDGIEIENPNSLNYTDIEKKVFVRIRKGQINLDGAKAREFLLYKYGENGIQSGLDNHEIFISALLERAEDIENLFLYKKVINRLMKDIDTNFSKKDLIVLVKEMPKINSSRILFYRMFGRNTVIKNEEFITPIENGQWLRERIVNLKKFISDEGPAPIADQINIEILNGSGNPGQAQSLRNYLIEYEFNVVHYGNALRNDYVNTIVIDRIGSLTLAKRVADIINCKEVYTRIDKTLLVDVTIIIGNDFEGRYVR
jgi:LCP family protein required for cell wall assembly